MSELDLASLTPDDIDHLRAVLGTQGGVVRSPGFKPLKDLRMPTTTKGRLHRPHFEWSAEDDGNTWIKPFPRLAWDAQGHEHRIETENDLATIPSSWSLTPPSSRTGEDPMARVRAEFESLSVEDQQFLLNAQKQARLNRINELMNGLSKDDLASLGVPKAEPKARKSA